MKTKLLIPLLLFSLHTSYSQFSEQLIISTEAGGARGVFATDIDGDGDLDVISAAESDDKVAWYKNLDGLGSFSSQNIITQSLNAAVDVYAADLDGDSDMDVLAASKGISQFDSKVVWFNNIDGQGNFSNEIIISEEIEGAIAVFAIDLDNDLDLDVLSASFIDNKVAWYENDGFGNFGSQQIITNTAYSTRDVYAADLDNDGDIDVLSNSSNEDKVVWFENLDGLGDFGTQQIISTETDLATSVYATDIDGDGDMDVLSASSVDNKIAWYKNLTPLGINELLKENIFIYPNPTNDYLFINSNGSLIQ